jgi:hypothetical protein
MKAWSAALTAEASIWPEVVSRSCFGFTALYRGECMFAVLPRTRGMETANALALRLDAPTPGVRARLDKDRRIGSAQIENARCFAFELSFDSDLHGALDWLGRAYHAAGKIKKNR